MWYKVGDVAGRRMGAFLFFPVLVCLCGCVCVCTCVCACV